ncbi:MAG: DNA/RNA non-specific endonuclease [Sphingobacteriales bacterium]|nr:DNA/RNA non-specific endonuclease [Sphingobacteriales bacterium]
MRLSFKRLRLLFVFVLFAFIANAQQTHINIEIPAHQANEKLITHAGYTLSYNEKYEQANWVAYELTSEETNSLYNRTNKFLIDPKISTGSADNSDYAGSGYDRGHLAPAGDMGWSAQSMVESFYYSNMSPQVPSFNRGIWKNAETFTREAAIKNHVIYVVTGPVFTSDMTTIGKNQVAVPHSYYKVILDYFEPEFKAIAFIIPNEASQLPLQHFAVSIDDVENITGLDFFPLLTDIVESKLESKFDINFWSWQNYSQSKKSTTSKTNSSSSSVQCTGTTKKGERCKRMTKDSSGKCAQHQN